MPYFKHGREGRPYWLLTGATGLVGQYLLKDMLLAGLPVAVLVRPNRAATAVSRIESILQRWEGIQGSALPRPVILDGDVNSPGLGLSAAQTRWIRQRVGHVLHSAAVLKFFGPNREAEPWLTNVRGTQHVLDCVQAAEVPDFHYVSTAYVSGRQVATVFEDDFPTSPQFRNDYEHSKWVAEGLVRAATLPKPPTIYRPVVIAGDSTTGYTSTYHGLYLYLRTMALLVPEQQRDAHGKLVTRIRLPMSGQEARNIVPVEWVAQVITHLLAAQQAHGKTFHLAPAQGITPNELIQYCYGYFGSTGVEFCPELDGQRMAENDFAAKVFDAIQIYQDYDNSDPHFDTANLQRYAGHLACPPLNQEVIWRYLEFGQKDRWGKARVAPPDLTLDGRRCVERLAEEIGDLLCHLSLENSASAGPVAPTESAQTIAFQLIGPGGGPFTIVVPEKGDAVVQPGIPQHPTVLLQMSVGSLQKWLSSDYTQRRQTTALWLQRAAHTGVHRPT
jgi:thioester reductase-like protein